MKYCRLIVIIMISLPLWVDAINGRNGDDTNLLTISSCVLANTSQLHHYCTDSHDQKDAVTIEDLNTIEISEKLCGEYKYHQGKACHDIELLFLKSDTKGLCISSSIANDSLAAHANIINDINHKYFPNCSSVGTLLILGDREFSCTLQDFDELEKIEFIIRGYNATIGDRWTATVTVSIQHHCSEGRSRTTVPYYVEIIATIILSLVAMVIFCIFVFVSYFKKSKTKAETETVSNYEQGQQSLTFQSADNVMAADSVHVVSNPVAVQSEDKGLKDNYTDNLGKGNFSVQFEPSTDYCEQAGIIVSNPIASEHDVKDNNKPVELCTISITVEAPQLLLDQQSTDNQDATSEHHSKSKDNLTDSKDSVATISSVYTTNGEQCITETCGPQQVTSPYGSLTKGSLPEHKRNSMSMDTLKRMIMSNGNVNRTTASSSETN